MADKSNRKGLEEICSYFIDDLRPYVYVELPNYGDFNYGEGDAAILSTRLMFLPVGLLLGVAR